MKKSEELTPIQKLKQDWEQLDELAGNPSISAIDMKRKIAEYQEKQKKRACVGRCTCPLYSKRYCRLP